MKIPYTSYVPVDREVTAAQFMADYFEYYGAAAPGQALDWQLFDLVEIHLKPSAIHDDLAARRAEAESEGRDPNKEVPIARIVGIVHFLSEGEVGIAHYVGNMRPNFEVDCHFLSDIESVNVIKRVGGELRHELLDTDCTYEMTVEGSATINRVPTVPHKGDDWPAEEADQDERGPIDRGELG